MSRRRPTRRAVAAFAAVVVVTSCAGDPAPDAATRLGSAETAPSTSPPGPVIDTVGVIGDSITVGAEDEIREALGDLDLDVVAVDAQEGRRLTVAHAVDAGLDAAARVRREDPDLWVVALGTNDVWSVADGADAKPWVDEMVDAIPAGVPLVWIDVFVEGAEGASDTVNAALVERLAERGDAIVASWHDVVVGSDLLEDGVHPTDAGDVAFAGVVARGVASWTG